MDLYLPALPAVQAELATGQPAVQLTLSAVVLGLAAGQLVAGPLSDRFGRRGPILVGVAAWSLASLLCAVAPNVWVLIGIRLLQGLGGAAGIVIGRAVVRDPLEGMQAARTFAVLASVSAGTTVLGPVAGGQLLRVTDWRGSFVVLAGLGLALVLATASVLRETLPPERRIRGGLRTTLVIGGTLLGRRPFLSAVLAQGLSFGALFAYISGSSFVFQDGFGLSAQQFSAVFAVNGIGLVLGGLTSRALVLRTGARPLLLSGSALQALAGAILLVNALAGAALLVVLPATFVLVASTGLILPNATALAMAQVSRAAGSASALIGAAQFALAGVGAPLAGIGAPGALLPMAAIITTFATLGACAAVCTPRRRPQGRAGA